MNSVAAETTESLTRDVIPPVFQRGVNGSEQMSRTWSVVTCLWQPKPSDTDRSVPSQVGQESLLHPLALPDITGGSPDL